MDHLTEIDEEEAFFRTGESEHVASTPSVPSARMSSLTPVELDLEFEPEPREVRTTPEQLARAERFRKPVALLVTGLGLLAVIAVSLKSGRERELAFSASPQRHSEATAIAAASPQAVQPPALTPAPVITTVTPVTQTPDAVAQMSLAFSHGSPSVLPSATPSSTALTVAAADIANPADTRLASIPHSAPDSLPTTPASMLSLPHSTPSASRTASVSVAVTDAKLAPAHPIAALRIAPAAHAVSVAPREAAAAPPSAAIRPQVAALPAVASFGLPAPSIGRFPDSPAH